MITLIDQFIWTYDGDSVEPRDAELRLDQDTVLLDDLDCTGILQVESGLIATDLVAILGFSGMSAMFEDVKLPKEQDGPDEIALLGYVVTEVNAQDGSGIMVSGDLAIVDPESWLNARVIDKWKKLHLAGIFLQDFDSHDTPPGQSLSILDAYIDKAPNQLRDILLPTSFHQQ